MDDTLSDLRIADVITFLAVHRSSSITGAARVLKVTPSQVSKAVTRLERALHLPLLVRGARGVSVSERGLVFAPKLEQIVADLRALRADEKVARPELTIAAPSYLQAFFAPHIAAALPDHRMRCLSLPPAQVRAYSRERLFQVAFTVGPERFSESWAGTALGPFRRGLFGSPAVVAKLGRMPVREEALLEHPFVSPIYILNGQSIPVEDGCPITRGQRRLGQEVETIGLGLELATASEQLIFGPVLAAQSHLRDGRLVEISVEGWSELVHEPIYVYCSGDALMSVQRSIVMACQTALARIEI